MCALELSGYFTAHTNLDIPDQDQEKYLSTAFPPPASCPQLGFDAPFHSPSSLAPTPCPRPHPAHPQPPPTASPQPRSAPRPAPAAVSQPVPALGAATSVSAARLLGAPIPPGDRAIRSAVRREVSFDFCPQNRKAGATLRGGNGNARNLTDGSQSTFFPP